MKPILPKTLILDIETAPIAAHVWGIWQQNVALDFIRADWYILSFAAKWVGKRNVFYFDQSKAPDIEDDKLILEALWVLLDEADIVVAHNGRKFDLRKINARFLLNGMKPPSPYKIVDTLEIAKKTFAFSSNKLEFLTGTLCTTKKLKHKRFPGVELWVEVLKGNPLAWKEMKRYNVRDVTSLEELYLLMRPWNATQPNAGVFVDGLEPVCAKCGSKHLEKRGVSRTQVGVYQRYQCKDCGGWSRGRKTQNSIGQRSILLTNAQ